MLGTCRACGRTIVSINARYCPRCNEPNPVDPPPDPIIFKKEESLIDRIKFKAFCYLALFFLAIILKIFGLLP